MYTDIPLKVPERTKVEKVREPGDKGNVSLRCMYVCTIDVGF